MARHNYGHEKRQKELKRQHKQEQKRQRKLDRREMAAREKDIAVDETADGPLTSAEQ